MTERIGSDSADRPAARLAWRRWLDTEHLGLALTLAYLFLAGLGMLHRALVLLRFRVNVFDYAEPSDFLLAALRDPVIVLVCVAPVPAVSLYFRLADWLRRRVGEDHPLMGGARGAEFQRRHRGKLYLLTVVLWALAASMFYARSVAEDLRAGKGRRVQVQLLTGAVGAPTDTAPLLLLGTTQKFIFLYAPERQVTSVIPVSNVAQLRYERRRPARTPGQ